MKKVDHELRMQSVFIVTMWSGGVPGKKWKTLEAPELLPQGTGVSFRSLDTKLIVRLIGTISVEEYQQGADTALEKSIEAIEAGGEGKHIL